MAYGKKYTITFKNRIQNDVYGAEIWEKDFAGDPTELTGAETPFVASYQGSDDDLFNPIKALEINLSVLSASSAYNISLIDFYSEDDEKYRIDFYCESLSNGTSVEKLLYTTYLLQEGSSEPVTDRKHAISLKGTDNLGLLKEISLITAFPDILDRKRSFFEIIIACLTQTGLYSTPFDLPIRVLFNLFENTTDDRSDDSSVNPLTNIFVHCGMFQHDDGTWDNCYDVLTKILSGVNACLIQAEGFWNIVRIPEYKLFAGQIPGTDSVDGDITYNSLINIDRGGTFSPISEDQISSIQRPLKYVKNTFNYVQPKSLIQYSDLQLPDGATPYETSTVGDFRYDKYSLASYFPNWIQTHSDTSYLMIVTDVSVTPETEVERYIVTPGATDEQRGVQFNYIEVTKNDTFDFSLKYRFESDDSGIMYFWVRFIIDAGGGNYYLLANQPAGGSSINVHWNGPYPVADWDDGLGFNAQIAAADDSGSDHAFTLSSMIEDGGKLPLIPVDGVLLIEVRASNGTNGLTRLDGYWKDITLTFTQFINQSTKIIGQTHTDEQAALIKNKLEQDLSVDDSPRNTIAGTLFTDAITAFVADSIGNLFFTKTTLWHRGTVSEELRLGNIITQERLKAGLVARTVIEGTFKNLRYTDSDDQLRFVNMLNLFTIGFFTGRNFIFSIVSFDYMACVFNGKLIEIFNDESLGGELNTNADITNYSGISTSLPLVFDDIVAAVNFSTDGSFIIYTYDGSTAILANIILNLGGSWNVADAATIHLKVNGVVVGSYVLSMGSFTASIEFSTSLSPGDTISASIDWIGAITYDVDIDSGALEVTSVTDSYLFKYLYETT